MAVFRKGSAPEVEHVSNYPAPFNLGRGSYHYRHLTNAGGLTQFGIALETLHPGRQSSQQHWEEHEDEFCFLLEGSLTVVEDDTETVLHPGDFCCWKANDQVAHTLRNHTDAPATYLIAGGRQAHNICHYPGLDLLATPEGYTHLDGTPYPQEGEDK
ncbi:cupin domain-containing protein [Acidimangrovimonas sediminis]|uniref:cupin domain-containing protein n=1 Tax=Acidimangrovimonas sediminis TaxID=2056283 RepID=UPI000C7FE793|nr:cupin domain-containing protein [Acidimangrovimonas sediminis]